MTGRARSSVAGDLLIGLSEAVTLVPFSETTLRRAIARGELEAWQPTDNGKLVLWRSALIAWATQRPAGKHSHDENRRERRLPSRRQRRTANATPALEPITLSDLT
jgi:hypothetical protein